MVWLNHQPKARVRLTKILKNLNNIPLFKELQGNMLNNWRIWKIQNPGSQSSNTGILGKIAVQAPEARASGDRNGGCEGHTQRGLCGDGGERRLTGGCIGHTSNFNLRGKQKVVHPRNLLGLAQNSHHSINSNEQNVQSKYIGWVGRERESRQWIKGCQELGNCVFSELKMHVHRKFFSNFVSQQASNQAFYSLAQLSANWTTPDLHHRFIFPVTLGCLNCQLDG